MIFLDKYGWPIESIEGKPVKNFIRRLIHTRKIVRSWSPTPSINDSADCKPIEKQR